jgi:Tfp pilus assembly protein PilO
MTRRPVSRKRFAVDRQQLVILLVAAVMAGSFFVFVLWPRQEELSALGSAVLQERNRVKQKVMTSHEGVYLTVQIAGFRKAQDRLAQRLPTDPALAEFLQDVAAQVATEPLVTHEVERSDVKQAGQAHAVPLRLKVTGPFEAVYRCLAKVENLERLSQFRSLRVSKREDNWVTSEAELVVYHMPAEKPHTKVADATQGQKPKAEKVRG